MIFDQFFSICLFHVILKLLGEKQALKTIHACTFYIKFPIYCFLGVKKYELMLKTFFYKLKNWHHFKRNCLGLYILIFIFYSRLAARLYNLLSIKSLVIIVGDSIFKSRGRILFILINNLILSFVFSS